MALFFTVFPKEAERYMVLLSSDPCHRPPGHPDSPRSAVCTPNFWKSYTEPPFLPGQMYKVWVLPKPAEKNET